jgi:antitoxin YefM
MFVAMARIYCRTGSLCKPKGELPDHLPRSLAIFDTPKMAIILVTIEVTMNEISKYVPITKAKNDLLELIRQVENIDESVAVTKNGVPTAVILSMEKYTGLLETLDILSDEGTAKFLRTSMRQARKGNWLRTDEVFRR